MKRKISHYLIKREMNTNQKRLAILISAIILVLLVVTIFIGGKGQNFFKLTETNKTAPVTPTPTLVPGDTIIATKHEFLPNKLVIKKGSVVNIMNDTRETIDIASDYGPLNTGVLVNGDVTELVKYDKAGTYNYYNKLKPDIKGSIVVQ